MRLNIVRLTISGIEAFATTAELDLARVAPPVMSPHRLSVILPPTSVTTFVGKLAGAN